VSDQVSHPHKTKDKIIVLYILIFIFLDSEQILQRIIASMNMQSRTADKRWSSSLGVGRGAINPHLKKLSCYDTDNCAWTDPMVQSVHNKGESLA